MWASCRPSVEVYSLICRARLALETTSPYRESTLPNRSSIFRSFSIFASHYYIFHGLYHIPARPLPLAVDDLVVELVAGCHLAHRRRGPGLHRLGRLGGPARKPAPRLLERRRPDEDHHRVGPLPAHLTGALELYLE